MSIIKKDSVFFAPTIKKINIIYSNFFQLLSAKRSLSTVAVADTCHEAPTKSGETELQNGDPLLFDEIDECVASGRKEANVETLPGMHQFPSGPEEICMQAAPEPSQAEHLVGIGYNMVMGFSM